MTNGNSSDKTYADRAHQYALDIISGLIPACKLTILACQRHLDDLSRKDFPYIYEPAKGNRFCAFIEMLPHVSGKWAAKNELLRLEPWQCFIVCSLFGWLKVSNGKRRFTLVYLNIPRKNAKSTLAAAIALYCLIFDGEFGGQVFAGATTEKQAHMVFDPARLMVLKTPKLSSKFGVEVAAKTIFVPKTNSKFECLIGKPGDGGSPSLAVVDEYHEHLTSDLLDTMLTGSVAREQPLALIITTSGSNIAGPCHLLQEQVEKTLQGVLDNPEWFCLIYSIDPEDDWSTDDALRKANPNLDVSVSLENLQIQQRRALQSADQQNIFKTKHLNVWCNAKTGFYNMAEWDACRDSDLTEDAFRSHECVIGLDLARTKDLCSAAKVFCKQVDGQDHYYVLSRHYLPSAEVDKPENRHYQKWAYEGQLTSTDGNATDYQYIVDDILADAQTFHVRELAFDPAGAAYLTQVISSDSTIEPVTVDQNKRNLSPTMQFLELLIATKRIHHDGDAVLKWCLSNTIARRDALEQVFPDHANEALKIDAQSALLDGLFRARALFGSSQTPDASAWTFEPFVI